MTDVLREMRIFRLNIMHRQFKKLVSNEGKERFARKANRLKKEIRDAESQ
ncbi:hypothetical protein [Enterovibrio nigricans]|uniref:Uncharacterized protein n=1 Tax=Enterovibrio nigricans DSM 22720 TaxID=1121868 RepID=A0A1T4UR29_9GAMM|nr:hypothetical protein [Enterovibrio nigricans]SKA55159.1 hypothetical protein SAMN02745132_02286 [Enterovibrio nigricans DSM 22720]